MGDGRKQYPAYKSSGIQWLGEVPKHWEVKRAKALLPRNDGGVWGEDFDDEGVIILRSTEQTVDGEWRIVEPAKRRLSTTEFNACRLLEGDLVVTKSSGSSLHIGKTSIVTKEIEALNCCYSNFMQRLRVTQNAVPRFVWYVLNGELGRKQFDYYSSTTTGLANLNGSIIGNVGIAVPPFDEQRAIVRLLDRETARIDALIAKKRRQIELLHEKRTALISHAVTKGLDPNAPMKDSGIDGLGDVPKHWQTPPLYARFSVELGKMLDAKQITGQCLLPYVRNVDVQWDNVNVAELPEMDIAPDEYTRYTLKEGDLLVCEGGEVGRTAIWRGELPVCAFQKAIHRLRPLSSRDLPRFFYYVMHATASAGVFVAYGNPNTIPHLTAEKLRVYRFAFPPTAEQRAIVSFLDRKSGKIDMLVEKVSLSIDRLREYRTAVISAAVTGKIDVRAEVAT